MNEQDLEGLLLYYGRLELFHTMQKTALDGLARYPTNGSFRLYNGIALVLGNRVQEGIRELNPLKNDADLGACAVTALLCAHKQCVQIDEDVIAFLEHRMKESLLNANSNTFYYTGIFLLLEKKFDKALDFASKTLKLNSHDTSAVLKAWAEINQDAVVSGNVVHILEEVLNRGMNFNASLALVCCYQQRGQFEDAIYLLNQLSVRYPELQIPLVVKMETYLAALDLDHAYEMALFVINLDPTNLIALQVKSLLLIVRDGNIKAAISALQQLLVATERVEACNSKILLQICRLFARICSRNHEVLFLTLRFLKKLIQLHPSDVKYIIEMGNERMFLGSFKEAINCFHSAIKIDNENIHALCGLTLCQLMENGSTEGARHQVDFLRKHQLSHNNPMFHLLNAIIAVTSEDAISFLSKATEIHLNGLNSIPYGPKYALHLDPEFLLQVTSEFLRHSPLKVEITKGLSLAHNTLHISLKHCISILDVILKFCPAHIVAMFTRAKVHFLCDELVLASTLLHRIINDLDSAYTDAYLLLSQIQLQQQEYMKALHSLELALSFNFSVRDNPKYYLLLGMGQRQNQQFDGARKSFLAAMHLLANDSDSRESIKPPKRIRTDIIKNFDIDDKVTLYLELICTCKALGDAQAIYEGEQLMQCAMEEFSRTSEEGRLVIAYSDFMLQSAKTNKAIELLSAIQLGQPYYIQARTRLANIHLQHRKDRVAFVKCFKVLAETCQDTESLTMLGEAYMIIQETDLAVEAFQTAFTINPQDTHLASNLGKALIKTHQYAKAIAFYIDAVGNLQHIALGLNLAELYLKLRQYKHAENVLATDTNQTQIYLPNKIVGFVKGYRRYI